MNFVLRKMRSAGFKSLWFADSTTLDLSPRLRFLSCIDDDFCIKWNFKLELSLIIYR